MTGTAVGTQLRTDVRKIAADIVTVGSVVAALGAVLSANVAGLHIPAGDVTIISSASAIVAGIVAEARRVAGAKTAAKTIK